MGGTTVPPTVTTVQAAEGENTVGGAKAEKLSRANVKKNKMDHSGQGDPVLCEKALLVDTGGSFFFGS